MIAVIVEKVLENCGYTKREIPGVYVGSEAVIRAWSAIERDESLTTFPDIGVAKGGSCVLVDYVDAGDNSRVYIYRGTEPDTLDSLYYVTYNVIESEIKY